MKSKYLDNSKRDFSDVKDYNWLLFRNACECVLFNIFRFTLIAFGEEKMLIHFDADILKQTMQEINNLKSKSANIMLIKIWFLFQYSEKLILNTL